MSFSSDKFLLDHLPGCIGWKDLGSRYAGANRGLLELKGLPSVQAITGKRDDDLSPEREEENIIFHEQDMKVLNGEKISIVHEDPFTHLIYFLEKGPILDQHNNISGIIYYCRVWEKADIFHFIKEVDKKFNINIKNYTLDYHQNIYQLTERECECVFLLIRGKTAKEIAAILSLSKRTIESYIENIKNKMNCQNKTEILVKALLSGYQNQIPSRLNYIHIIKSL